MARARGKRDRPGGTPAGLLFAAGRMVGFLLTAGLGVGLIGLVVLLPAYARLAQTRYDCACQEVQVADLAALTDAQERMIAALPKDEILTLRLVMSQEHVAPSDGVAYALPSVGPSKSPDLIDAVRHPRPAPPPDWLVRTDAKLHKPSTRRGLLLLAAGALVVAMFLFAPPERYRRSRPAGYDL